jgi:hypothetical protein
MSSTEFPDPGPGAGINSQIALNRAHPIVLRNSRILIGLTLFGSIVAATFSVLMLFGMISEIIPLSAISVARGFGALQWALASLSMGLMCPWLWKLGRKMAGYRVKLDSRGADFNLGTKKQPSELFLTWEQIAAIKHKRIGNAQWYFVQGTDGSEARFSSYTFFRPKKVARLVAARTGQAIQEA